MKRQCLQRRLIFCLFVLAFVLLSGCAAKQPSLLKKNLEASGEEIVSEAVLPNRVIAYREKDLTGLVVDYSILKLSKTKKGFELVYLDPEKVYHLDGEVARIYFKVDTFNPSIVKKPGQLKSFWLNVNLTKKIEIDGLSSTSTYDCGAVPNATYYFDVPVHLLKNELKMSLEIWMGNMQSVIQTIELVVKPKGKENSETN